MRDQLARAGLQAEQLQARLTSGRELLGSSAESLTISQHLYDELVRAPPDALTLRQAVQLRLYEALQPLQAANEHLRRELSSTREQAREQTDAAIAEARDARHAASVAEAQAAGLREQHRLQVATEARLTSRVDELLKQVRKEGPQVCGGAVGERLSSRSTSIVLLHRWSLCTERVLRLTLSMAGGVSWRCVSLYHVPLCSPFDGDPPLLTLLCFHLDIARA